MHHESTPEPDRYSHPLKIGISPDRPKIMQQILSAEVSKAIESGGPVVALESTVISHGLPFPDNLDTIENMETAIRGLGVVPATIAILKGNVHVGLEQSQLETLSTQDNIKKVSVRDLPVVVARSESGATTVAATVHAAERAGIGIFATGGIGGVHRGSRDDVSADLPTLAASSMIVVCSGAKAILDLPATREWLETNGVTVLGYRCDEFPAFYSRSSGLDVDARVESCEEIVTIARARDSLGIRRSILVTVPVPVEHEIKAADLDPVLEEAVSRAKQQSVIGRTLTPYLLSVLTEMTGGRTLRSNTSLLLNNARTAARIALAMGAEE